MNSDPLVSIVIPVYNGSNYMREAIDSALSQTYQNIEIIVVNDGSNDSGETERIALSYGNRIRYFHKENGGVSSALNLGIIEMKGEYFSWLSHDDAYTPSKVESEIEALRPYLGQEVIANCRTMMIDENSNEIPYKFHGQSLPTDKLISSDQVLKHILRHSSLGGCNLLIPKALFVKYGMFDESLRYAQDELMWFTFFSQGAKMIKVDTIGVKNRMHSAQLTLTGKDMYTRDSERVCSKVLPLFEKISSRDNDFVYEYALRQAKYNQSAVVSDCIKHLKEHNRYNIGRCLKLRTLLRYAKLRPAIKNIYHSITSR